MTGAQRYFKQRAAEQGYSQAYANARNRAEAIDRLVTALDSRRKDLGLSKAELARRAELAPEIVRRLFTAEQANPTIGTLMTLADAMGLELVPRRKRR